MPGFWHVFPNAGKVLKYGGFRWASFFGLQTGYCQPGMNRKGKGDTMQLNEETLRNLIRDVIGELQGVKTEGFVKDKDPSGIFAIRTKTVKTEPFAGAEGVRLLDVTTLDEAPRMGAGIMELDHARFEWTLTYDEYDFVIDGILEIETDGRVVTGYPGDIIYIPKDSHIFFRSPNKTRYAYFVYPANWQEE